MTEHEIKAWPEFYTPVERGEKTLELRLNDRNYQVGDVLLLREYEPLTTSHTNQFTAFYTGRSSRYLVTHIIHGGPWLTPGYVAMSIRRLH